MRIGVGTIAAGREGHLHRQAAAVSRSGDVSDYVVVSMDARPAAAGGARVLHLPAGSDPLPLAAARNLALDALSECDLAILLDVDCLPGAELVAHYAAAARRLAGHSALLCGPVGYLDPLPAGSAGPVAEARRRARARRIRDFPRSGIRREPRHELFWSLSFAVSPRVHRRIGGFDEGFRGWGAEDTDYGLRARDAGAELWLAGGAWAYHQHHPAVVTREPVAVAANARRFQTRWGYWPMPDQLRRLADAGLIAWDPDGDRCVATS